MPIIHKQYFQKFKTVKYSTAGCLKRYLITNFIRQIDEILFKIQPQTIIELGCGEGFVCGWLKSQYSKIKFSGADINKSDLQLLQQHFPDINIFNFDLENIINSPIKQKSFDVILCLETLEHLNNPTNFLAQLKKIKFNDLIISVPWEPSFRLVNFLRGQNLKNWGNDPEHLHCWNNKQMRQLLAKQFTIQQNIISFPWQIFWLKKTINK